MTTLRFDGRNDGDLRRQAELRMPKVPANLAKMQPNDSQRLVYELEIHQEELLIQNEELRRVQSELRASCERYSDLYDFAPVGYLTVDEDSKIVEMNLTAASMLKRARAALIGRPLALHCTQSSRARFRTHLDAVMATHNTHSCEISLNPSGTDILDVRLDSQRVVSPSRQDWNCRIILTDISVRKRVEMALFERDKALKLVTGALPVLIAYIDRFQMIQSCSASLETWFQNLRSEPKGQRIQDIFADDSFASDSSHLITTKLMQALEGKPTEVALILQHPNSGRRNIQLSFVPDFDAQKRLLGIHCLGVDNTEKRILEMQGIHRQEVLARLSKLTNDERAVYDLLVLGKQNQFVAVNLDIGLRTAERRRQSILRKLQVDSLAEWLQTLANAQGRLEESI